MNNKLYLRKKATAKEAKDEKSWFDPASCHDRCDVGGRTDREFVQQKFDTKSCFQFEHGG